VAGLLGVPSIGVTDNFFLLGGHSLLGTQLIVRMRDAFGVDLPLRAVFDHPTIEALADEVERMLLIRLEAA
jgi:acyl carrier protein